MKQLALAVGLMLLTGTAMAQTDLQQKQLDKNANRRNRQAEFHQTGAARQEGGSGTKGS